MSELLALIDEYRMRHGQPSDASIARAIGISPQAVSSWRRRGIRSLPERETLRRLAEFIGASYEAVILAAAQDAGYLQPKESDGDGKAAPKTG